MAGKKETRQVQVDSDRGMKRPPAPQASETADGKPPGSQSVRRTKR